jgi:hypothetical protein
MDRFNLKQLNDMEVTEHYEVKISYRFAAFGNLDGGCGGGNEVDNQ